MKAAITEMKVMQVHPPEHGVEARPEPRVDVGGEEEVQHRPDAADSEGRSKGGRKVVVLEVCVGDGVLGHADAAETSPKHN